MDFFPSPPSSPTPSDFDKVMCGECDKPLGSDWFCSDCHKRCEHCNRFLTNEPCSRCWAYDAYRHSYVRKPLQPTPFFFHNMPSYHHPFQYNYNQPHYYYYPQHDQCPSPQQIHSPPPALQRF